MHKQPTVTGESPEAIRRLIDNTSENVRALKALGVPTDNWDCMLIFMVTERLDGDTRRQWELTLTEDQSPTFGDLAEFVERRCRALEASGTEPMKVVTSNRKSDTPSSKKSTTTDVYHTVKTRCAKCGDNHPLFRCERFQEMPVEHRISWVKTSALCYNCLKRGHTVKECKSSHCKTCGGRHNTQLHRDHGKMDAAKENNAKISAHFTDHNINKHVLLATANVKVNDISNKPYRIKALLDSGSQASFISESGVQCLGLKRKRATVNLGGLGAQDVGTTRGCVQLQLESMDAEYHCQVEALVVHNITEVMPHQLVDTRGLTGAIQGRRMELADPLFYKPGRVDLLIGADIYYDLLEPGNFKSASCGATFQKTKLGWIVAGVVQGSTTNRTTNVLNTQVTFESLSQQLKKFWELERVSKGKHPTKEEIDCEAHFRRTHSRTKEGRFMVQLPFSQDGTSLGDTQTMARTRFLQIERKLANDPVSQHEYMKFMKEYSELGHMQEIHEDSSGYYLPHHYVVKDSSSTTRLRVVFDATAKPTKGLALNDVIQVGPTIQDELFDIIIRFRTHKVALTADITKMYRQVLVHPEHRKYQKILWRQSANHRLKTYQLNTLTYGTASAPFLAIRCLVQLAETEQHRYPRGAMLVKKDFYVDDLLSGAETTNEARQIQEELIQLLGAGGFELRKWASNDASVIESLPEQMRNQDYTLDLTHESIKTLGIHWQPGQDQFMFKATDDHGHLITKRTILSQIARLFDPLGWLAPMVIQAKIIIQKLWLLGIGWDDEPPADITQYWQQYQKELLLVNTLRIQRRMVSCSHIDTWQLHGYSDASEVAYGAVIFIRSINKSNIESQLVCSKSRVAPLKSVSLPRLELCGAVMVAQLLVRVASILSVKMEQVHAWTDSTIVLAWIRKPPHNWKPFVANRVTEIQELVDPSHWKHVRSEENPADCLSRGLSVTQLEKHSMWWHGPKWLVRPEEQWPCSIITEAKHETEDERRKIATHLTTNNDQWLLARYSSLNKLVRVSAYCRRFGANCRATSAKRNYDPLTVEELRFNKTFWIQQVQTSCFNKEIQNCINGSPLNNKSPLKSLNPFIDDQGIMRVGGRSQEAPVSYSMKHPIILPHHHTFTELVIKDAHVINLHAGPQLLLAVLRKSYWIIRARQVIRHVIHRCVRCRRHQLTTTQQMMGSLPKERLEPARAFIRCGVDYAGPFTIKLSRGRGNMASHKAYVCIFVCFTTHAIHIELVNDLTTHSFIAALRRFTARRGQPTDIFSDCGTNFVGAQRELRELQHLIASPKHNDEIASALSTREISWHFSPPATPHFGGLWEAGVKSIKYHMRRVIGLTRLTYEELYTVLTQVEACLNSRPLCPMSNDPHDLTYLTPGHFIIGEALTAVPDRDVTSASLNRLDRWQLIQRLYQQFWKKWSSEQVARIQQRPKWTTKCPNLKEGNLVLLVDHDRSPMKWPMARVVQTHPGKDGLVRIVTVRTKDGLYRRPVTKCGILPIDQEIEPQSEVTGSRLNTALTMLNSMVQGGRNVQNH